MQNGTDKLKLNFDYGTINNNGNVLSQQITVPTVGTTNGFVATQVYAYDSLNRLKSAEEMIPNQTGWKQTFLYDRYGNRNFEAASTTTPNAQSTLPKVVNPEVLTTNNRFKQDQDNDGVADYLYDAGGNTTKDALGRTFVYDAENKQTEVIENSATIGRYFYDGDGKRVKKMSATETVIFIYDAAGKLVAEYANQIAQPSEAKVSYLTSDHLGSPRINTDANGSVISRHDYQPFGEEIYPMSGNTARTSYGNDKVRKQFTSYERDNESDLDFAQARMYGYLHGRFTSPDDFLNDTHVSDPQSWNLYVYVRNNPLRLIDPTGEEIEKKDGKVRFDSDGKVVTATVETATRKVIVNGKEETRTVTVKAKFTEGKIYSKNNGETTEIQAYQSAGPLEVIETNEKGEIVFSGTVEKYEGFSGVTEFRGLNNTSNCHGTTFANGEVWIQNNQVEKLMKAEGYDVKNPNSTPTDGSVGIFSTDGKLNDPRHSVRVLSLNPTMVESKGGVYPREVTTPAKSWTDTDPSRKNHKLLYYTQRATK